ncbi:2OG-Fe dioxygenase family protein [Melaminivora jejuensis]|uniref:2OG-Fe dioxygenase family protein n=1 Tax=Melaminivora jejuensis TaxID=1267217 RepID=UPI001ADF805F|nr:2OG-Fe dioxygenase family protein [Melaminivora jejuensis]UHJ66186.1 2OG-Fe dioxygenase family protein [Melaminivora jejuensis]
MAHITFSPPYVPPCHVVQQLRDRGYAVLRPADTAAWAGCSLEQLQALEPDWDDLPPDEYLRDGGRYRNRRHASFVWQAGALQQAAHRAHYQPVEYNALHGGMRRWFAPMLAASTALPGWQALLQAVADTTRQALAPQEQRWFVEAHQFRIDTEGGIGRPTPEGAHRDGVDLVAVFLVARQDVKGGETRIFEAAGPNGQRFTLSEPWSVMLLDDARMIHETTPIQPEDGHGWRDTLVLTCRKGAFLGDDVSSIHAPGAAQP